MLNNKFQQIFLKTYKYYYKDNIDGIKGTNHSNAIKAFQKDSGIESDGIWGSVTQKKSEAAAVYVQKAVGASVDGIIGDETIAKIKTFQKAKGLTADGIVGSDTLAAFSKTESHFSKSEFRCGCNGRFCDGYGGVEPSPSLLAVLEGIRSAVGNLPIDITSGIRCYHYNKEVGGVSGSYHLTGRAADIYINGITDSSGGRDDVQRIAYRCGATYVYHGTASMGSAVHVEV